MSPAVCAQCYEIVDQDSLQRAIVAGREYRHGCGRLLVRKSEEPGEPPIPHAPLTGQGG